MKKLFKKQPSGALIGTIALGTVIAGGLTWLLCSKAGSKIMDNLKASLKEKGTDILANAITGATGVSKDITGPAAEKVVE